MEDLVMGSPIAQPLTVPPAAIESTLNYIWETLTAEGGVKMRACLFNLILVTKNTQRSAYIRGVAQRVIEKFPSRILFITIEEGKKDPDFQTAVSVISPGHASDIACDLIEFSVSAAAAERIPYGVLPHLIPDLPIYLLWADDPIQENPLSYQLEKLASRIIFDSEATDNLPLFAKSILHHRDVGDCDIADLNWARTENWRALILSTFRSPERFKELSDIASLKIEYNALETTFFCHTRIQAIYLQGWLACQLGWHYIGVQTTKTSMIFTYKSPQNKPLTVELIPTTVPLEDLAPGAISSFILGTNGDANFRFIRVPETPQQINLFICSRDVCQAPVQFMLTKGGIGLTLVKEICRKGTSAHYLRLLNYLTKLEPQKIC